MHDIGSDDIRSDVDLTPDLSDEHVAYLKEWCVPITERGPEAEGVLEGHARRWASIAESLQRDPPAFGQHGSKRFQALVVLRSIFLCAHLTNMSAIKAAVLDCIYMCFPLKLAKDSG